MIDIDGDPTIMSGLLDITARKAAQVKLEMLASTDPLTGLHNRLSFFSAGRAEMMRAARTGSVLALLMIDIDHFKQINDMRGHQAGDMALRAFALLCIEELGPHAMIGRLGGEEFGVLLPRTGTEAAIQVAETLCERVAAIAIDVHEGSPVQLTVSVGVAGVRTGDRDIDGALARADLALYGAKRGGRNRVVANDACPASTRRTG
ncbi:MAG: GGDEF domain-containing protein [Sphingomonadales bacterium]|nr:MAG: GGDEF domain-containing protein [Sphingomonadales bacterium]